MRRLLIPLIALFLTWAGPAAGQALDVSTWTVVSPDEALRATVLLDNGVPYYRVRSGDQQIVAPSRLGVVLADGDTLGVGMDVVAVERAARDTTWTQPWGEVAHVHDHHRELRLRLQSRTTGRRMDLIFRVFDNGMGFRYAWPEQPNLGRFRIMDELTGFRFAANPQAWWIRAYQWNRYEYLYEESPLSAAGYALHTPLTMAFPDGGPYVAVHEAALVDYAGMSLRRTSPTAFQADLAPWSTGVRVYAEAPHRSPWRTLLVNDTPGGLITNYTVLNLNEPNALGDVSWVEPSKYIGIWWALHLGEWTWGDGPDHGATTAHTRRYIDFAAEHGFEGVLVEGWNVGWNSDWTGDGRAFSFVEPYPDYDLQSLAAYARAQGTRLIGHHETGGGAPHYEAQMDTAYALMNDLGVKAIKSGYVDWGMHFPRVTAPGDTAREWNYGQYMVNHYQRTVETAAEHRIALNIHEAVKGTGLRRTYPNLHDSRGRPRAGVQLALGRRQRARPRAHARLHPHARWANGLHARHLRPRRRERQRQRRAHHPGRAARPLRRPLQSAADGSRPPAQLPASHGRLPVH